MVEDARYRTKDYLETYLNSDNILEDDGVTAAKFIVCFGNPDYPLMRVFNDRYVDLVFGIGKPESTPMDPLTQAPYGYKEGVPITIFCIDKTGITGTKLRWKAEKELRCVTEPYPQGSQRSLSRMRDNEQRLGSTILYSVEYILHYRRGLT